MSRIEVTSNILASSPEMVAGIARESPPVPGQSHLLAESPPRIRQDTANITLAPLKALLARRHDRRTKPFARKKDVKGSTWRPFVLNTSPYSAFEWIRVLRALQLRRALAQGFMFRQPIDEISCYHSILSPNQRRNYCLTTYQMENRLCFSGERLVPSGCGPR